MTAKILVALVAALTLGSAGIYVATTGRCPLSGECIGGSGACPTSEATCPTCASCAALPPCCEHETTAEQVEVCSAVVGGVAFAAK